MLILIGFIRGLTTIRDRMDHARDDPQPHSPQRPRFGTGIKSHGEVSRHRPRRGDVSCPPDTGSAAPDVRSPADPPPTPRS